MYHPTGNRDHQLPSPSLDPLAVFGTPATNVWMLATVPIAHILKNVPDKGETVVRLPLPQGRNLWIIRDKDRWQDLTKHVNLDRDHAHDFSRECFGDPIFTAPYGSSADPADAVLHDDRKTALKSKLSPRKVGELAPRIAEAADRAVAEILASGGEPIDVTRQLLAYLFAVGGEALTGMQVDISAHIDVFQSSIDTMADAVGSPFRSALAALSNRLSSLLASGAREARYQLHDISRALIEAGARAPGGSHVAAILNRHGIDIGSALHRNTPSPDLTAALDEIAMEFAATVFTTTSLMTLVMNHFINKPGELETLRDLMDADSPRRLQGSHALLNTPAVRKLFLTLLENLPVNVGARGAVGPIDFTDSQGTAHAIRKNDVVLFDLQALQKRCTPSMLHMMDNAPATQPLFDFLSPQVNGGNLPMFFAGPTMCPGRYLAIQEALPFLLKFFAECNPRWLHDGTPAVKLGVVNGIEGKPAMLAERRWFDAWSGAPGDLTDVQPVLHETLHGPGKTGQVQLQPIPAHGDAVPRGCPMYSWGGASGGSAHPLAKR